MYEYVEPPSFSQTDLTGNECAGIQSSLASTLNDLGEGAGHTGFTVRV